MNMNAAISIGEPWMRAAFTAFVLFAFGAGKAHKVAK